MLFFDHGNHFIGVASLHCGSRGGHVPCQGGKWGWGHKKNVLGPLGSGHRVCPGDQGVPELQERVRAIESLSAQITQLLVGMSGSLGGIHSQG